jgi:hypothetical protein
MWTCNECLLQGGCTFASRSKGWLRRKPGAVWVLLHARKSETHALWILFQLIKPLEEFQIQPSAFFNSHLGWSYLQRASQRRLGLGQRALDSLSRHQYKS